MERKHYSTKLKEEKAQLLVDLYAILDGNLDAMLKYKMMRQHQIDFEKVLLLGASKHKFPIKEL